MSNFPYHSIELYLWVTCFFSSLFSFKKVEIGDFFEKDIEGGHPDAVFIGGHGNRLEEMIQHIDSKLVPNGKLVMNTVSERSKEIFIKTTKKLGYQLESSLTVNINEFNAINVLAATKQLA